jgi:carbamoyl-phosphate synthase / aspartate carbamoyltransferase
VTQLLLGFDERFERLSSTSEVVAALETLPRTVPLVLNACKANVPAVLFFAGLYDRAVHVTHVATGEVMELIALSKAKGVRVTCDVCIHNLFYSKADGDSAYLAEAADVASLWQHMEYIDCLVVGYVPSMLAKDLKLQQYSGYATAMTLLMSAVRAGKLSFEALREKMHDNPKRIFRLTDQPDTYIEVCLCVLYVCSCVYWYRGSRLIHIHLLTGAS